MALNLVHLVVVAVLSELELFSLDLNQQRPLAELVVFEFEVVPLIVVAVVVVVVVVDVVFDLAGLHLAGKPLVCEYHSFDSEMFDLMHLHYSRWHFVVATIVVAAIDRNCKVFCKRNSR